MTLAQEFLILGDLGFQIAASLYLADPASRRNVSVVLAPATGVIAAFYTSYAIYLSRKGCDVLLFDYQGLGESLKLAGGRIQKLKHISTIPHWSSNAETCMIYMRKRFNHSRLVYIGHSVGGHVAPLSKEKPDRLILISVNTAYHGISRANLVEKMIFYGISPSAAELIGYFPSARMGLGEDIPAGAGKLWATWGRRRHYILANKEARKAYKEWTVPTLAISFDDDNISNIQGFVDLLAILPNCDRTWYHIDPPSVGIKKIGHSGFFFKQVGLEGGLWDKTLPWIVDENPPRLDLPNPIEIKKGEGGFDWSDTICTSVKAKL